MADRLDASADFLLHLGPFVTQGKPVEPALSCSSQKKGRPGRTGTPTKEKGTRVFPTSSPGPWKHSLPVHSDPGSTCPR